MSLQAKFSSYHGKISLGHGADSYKSAREKDDSILRELKSAFKDAGYPVIDSFLQGSMATRTAIKHKVEDFDIDRAVVIDYQQAPENPVEVKKLVLKVLEKRGFKNAKIKKPCITADYASLNLHIDITVYRRRGDFYELAVGKFGSDENNREWSASDPKGLIDYINNSSVYLGSSQEKLSQFKRSVRYMKRWRDHQFSDSTAKKVYSIGLTTMLKNEFQPGFNADGKQSDLIALRATVSQILDTGKYFLAIGGGRYKVTVPLPVTPYLDIFDGAAIDTGTQLYNKLCSLRGSLENTEKEASLKKQCENIQKIFGDDFDVPEKEQNNKPAKSLYTSAGIVGTSNGA